MNAFCTVTCWSSAKPISSAIGSVAISLLASSESVKWRRSGTQQSSVADAGPTAGLPCPPDAAADHAARRRWASASSTEHAEIEALVERAWEARVEHFGDSTDMCSLVNAKSGGCAEDCGFCAQSQVRRRRHADARDDGARADPRARARRRGGRRAPLLHGRPRARDCRQARLREGSGGREAGRRAHQPQALRFDRAHVGRARAGAASEAGIQRVHHNVETAESYYPEVSTTVRYEGRLRTIDGGPRGRARDLRRRHPQPRRDARAARRDGVRAGGDQPDQRADQPAQPAPRDEVRRPRADGPVGGGQVDRDLPPDPARGAVPSLRRAGREPRRAAGARPSGRG